MPSYISTLENKGMTHSIAFHSYKGGTGKTTIAANLAAMLAAKGYNVSLLDLDVYAPSLHSYFEFTPDKWINDLLFSDAEAKDVIVDMTPIVEKYAHSPERIGKLRVGFSNPQKEEVYKLEGSGKQTQAKIQLLRKFIQMREDLISTFDSDYVILDTSPGIRYWSINSLAIADTLFLTLKFGELDIEGTRKMASDIYSSFTKFGAKSYLLLNRVGGYCVPYTLSPTSLYYASSSSQSPPQQQQQPSPSSSSSFSSNCSGDNSAIAMTRTTTAVAAAAAGAKEEVAKEREATMATTIALPQQSQTDFSNVVSNAILMDVISAIPCYCDIQFSRKEFLTGLQYPSHPFAKQLESLATATQIKV
jgi:chromosome partitioning protein